MHIWGNEPTRDEREAAENPLPLIVAVLVVAGVVLLVAPESWRREAAFEDAQRREHLQRLEAARPGALEALRAIAAEQRAK